MSTEPRVQIQAPVVGICNMRVCAVNDATDAEILEVCNRENPAGTSNGWMEVTRETGRKSSPLPCEKYPETRTHFMVNC